MESAFDLSKYHSILNASDPIRANGTVTKVVGLVAEARGISSKLGNVCDIYPYRGKPGIKAEVSGFKDDRMLLMPLEETRGIGPGSRVVAKDQKALIGVGESLLGRVIDGLGNPIDGKGIIPIQHEYPIYVKPINPLLRKRIDRPMDIGIRSLNSLLTIGCGQRMGIFSGSGVGKSVMLGMIARKTKADVKVIALIGERGRELNEFIEKELGEEGLKSSVVVVATSENLPLIRMRGAFIATAIAEYFRDQGKDVILMMDSITRFAMAQREVGLALGEPPTTKGYTPSVFTLLPKLLERAGTSYGKGTITGLYTVLVEGDDMNEPVADAVRSILDGHITLSREIANQNQYPAIDILNSISRVMDEVTTLKQRENANRFRETLATYRKAEDLINIGAYLKGSNPEIDYAIDMMSDMKMFMKQGRADSVSFEESVQQLEKLLN